LLKLSSLLDPYPHGAGNKQLAVSIRPINVFPDTGLSRTGNRHDVYEPFRQADRTQVGGKKIWTYGYGLEDPERSNKSSDGTKSTRKKTTGKI